MSDKDNILKELTFLLAAISLKYHFARGRRLRTELRYSTGTLYRLNH